MKKALKIAKVVLSVLTVIGLMGLAEATRRDVKFTDLKVEIDTSEENYFIDDLDIESQVFAHGYQSGIEPVLNIDKRMLENQFDAMPSVKKAEVYHTLNGVLDVHITQRTPLVRVFSGMGSFYLDDEGYVMPLSTKYTARVPIANGFIAVAYDSVSGKNFANFNTYTDTHPESRKLVEAYQLSKKFKEVELWNAQFKQFYFLPNGDIELVPAVGNHVILIDGVENLEESLTKLMILYKEGLNKTGWNDYKVINLKYKDQIVGIKR